MWVLDIVRPWQSVVATAKASSKSAHVGTVLCIVHLKRSEAPKGRKDRKYKARYVFRGSMVKDEFSEVAVLNALSSSPASMEASKIVDAVGSQPG